MQQVPTDATCWAQQCYVHLRGPLASSEYWYVFHKLNDAWKLLTYVFIYMIMVRNKLQYKYHKGY